MPTDLRAALRDAAAMLARVKPIDLNVGDDPHGLAERCRALADAPPTVAELLPIIDATHRVRWLTDGDHHEAYADHRGRLVVSILGADDRHAQFTDIEIEDLRRPGRLVEATP